MDSVCPSASASAACAPAHCHWRCALSVIDELLAQPGAASGEETDHLLELRWHLRQRDNAEAALNLFCDLRRRMEHRHYLAFFRLRRWLENHLAATAETAAGDAQLWTAVKLDYYCVEALRRACLCSALGQWNAEERPRIRFRFRVALKDSKALKEQASPALVPAEL